MVTLANLRPEDLVVDPVPAIQAIGQGVGDVLVNRAQEQVFSETSSPDQKRNAFLRISKINPQFGQVVLGLLEKQETDKLTQIQQKTDEQARFATLLLRQGNHDKRVKLLQDKANEAVVEQEDPSELLRMAELDQDQLNAELQEAIIQATDVKTIVSPNVQEVDPTKFTPESVQAFSQSQNFGDLVPVVGAADSPLGKVDPTKFTPESLKAFNDTGDPSKLVPIGTAQTDEAKRIVDQELINQTFGVNSPEARALKEAFAADKKDPATLGEIGSMRNQFLTRSSGFVIGKAALKKVLESEPTAIGDLNKMVAFMKTIDKTSQVTPGERATVEDAGNIGQRLFNLYNRLVGTGERLTPVQRANIDNQALKNFNTELNDQKKLQKFFTDAAKRAGIDPENVVLDLIDTRLQTPPPPAPPAPPGGRPLTGAGLLLPTAQQDLDKALQPGGSFERFRVEEVK